MMALVYSKAAEVLIWLGDLDQTMTDVLHEIYKFDETQRLTGGESFRYHLSMTKPHGVVEPA